MAFKKYTKKPEIKKLPRKILDWSPLQINFFNAVENEKGNLALNARAGCSKTTTIVEAIWRMYSNPISLPKPSICVMAFGKLNAEELIQRVPEGVIASTFHSAGLAALRNKFGKINVSDYKLDKIIISLLGSEKETLDIRRAVDKVVSLAKAKLYSSYEQMELIIDDPMYSFDLDSREREIVIINSIKALEICKQQYNVVDFDDMVWLPVVLGLEFEKYNKVIIDEAQDCADVNLAMIENMSKYGSAIFVYDDRQAIFGFRGADINSVGKIIERFNPKVMPLNVTYRCPKSVVALAKEIVPDYEVDINAPEGEVNNISMGDINSLAKPNDFIISRTNAPWVKICLSFLKEGRLAQIRGRNMGEDLVRFIDRSECNDVDSFLEYLENWQEIQIERAEKKNQDIDVIIDRAETLRAFCEGHRDLQVVKGKIQRLFSDEKGAGAIQLMSGHRCKGLEAKNVYIIRETFLKSRKNKKTKQMVPASIEEYNVYYVSLTRAMEKLYLAN
jgi:superfamily I DNA/RNA helicase